MNILIAGGSGGIGRALIQQCQIEYPEAQIHATYRTEIATDSIAAGVQWWQVDFAVEDSLLELAQAVASFDLIICATGFLWSENHRPEKSVSQFDTDFFIQNITANTVPTLLLAKHFSKHLKASGRGVLVSFSARIGSITDNQLGGWISYRSAKAALNMAVKTIAVEWQRTQPNSCIFAFHPGTTDTALSQPFQKSVPNGKLFTATYVAQCLLRLIEQTSSEQTGQLLAYDGTRIDW
ncbi:SDR family NAD(P)-dependent oxidoreductase [Reinekea thalattae]|uniref:SDR family NAD(P)-dependent oxidoreductase n=1 Tax=Reinekea thalattae TaxID=2593301 RepID=A0A5C8ZD91_9GAMM|nr:SDR family NAD(P)-dependent oxidoreductase [Reinekea thalattae]TXR54886.1 SDR family NAD(P)-dependent oxidoreductase [Reinekea thalattae]